MFGNFKCLTHNVTLCNNRRLGWMYPCAAIDTQPSSFIVVNTPHSTKYPSSTSLSPRTCASCFPWNLQMLKRSRPEEAKNGERPGKRFRPNKPCLINSLSDELFLRIFSLLSTQDLARCQRVSHRFNRIAGDSQVWKLAFYTRFVQPRLSRIQSSLRRSGEELGVSNIKWMDNEKKAGSQEKHWKRLYKLQHNWMRGSCDVREVGISDCGVQTPEINLQVTMQNVSPF